MGELRPNLNAAVPTDTVEDTVTEAPFRPASKATNGEASGRADGFANNLLLRLLRCQSEVLGKDHL